MLEPGLLRTAPARAFTLLEVLVGLAVAAILVTAVIPGMAHLLREYRADTALDALTYAMRLARSEAAVRKRSVAVCAGRAGACTDGDEWEGGWMVFTDPDGDHDCRDDGGGDCSGGGRILHRARSLPDGLRLSVTGNPGRHGFVVYDPRGFAMGYAATFTFCHETGDTRARGFTLNMNGRIEFKDAEELDCR